MSLKKKKQEVVKSKTITFIGVRIPDPGSGVTIDIRHSDTTIAEAHCFNDYIEASSFLDDKLEEAFNSQQETN